LVEVPSGGFSFTWAHRKVSSAILEDRLDTMNKLASLENMESSELAQKAKVKWSIEGDENSKFFHGIINKRRNNLAIRGIMVDGIGWKTRLLLKRSFFLTFKTDLRLHVLPVFLWIWSFLIDCLPIKLYTLKYTSLRRRLKESFGIVG
nr:RNA-directed DNA polymerase, eukaryota [Tanacetum cinerariifolium]